MTTSNRASSRLLLRGTCAAFLLAVSTVTAQGQGTRTSVPPCDADNGGLTLLASFCAIVAADALGVGRDMAVAPNGDLFVSLRAAEKGAASSRCATRTATAASRSSSGSASRAAPGSCCATATSITLRKRRWSATR